MKNIILFVSLLFISVGVQASTEKNRFILKFGGWSQHFNTGLDEIHKKEYGYGYDYNESHNGIGFDYLDYRGNDNYVRALIWYMKDSHNQNAYQAGLGYGWEFDINKKYLNSLMLNLDLIYFNRNFMKTRINGYRLDGDNYIIDRVYELERKNFIFPIPSMTLFINKHFNIDMTFLLYKEEHWDIDKISDTESGLIMKEYNSPLFFIRFGWEF